MVASPKTLSASATVADARAQLSSHVHVALIVDATGRLLTVVDRGDLEGADSGALAAGLGALESRVVAPDADAEQVRLTLRAAGLRRVAVVDSDGLLLGLMCLKRHGGGFCTDEGVAARAAERDALRLS